MANSLSKGVTTTVDEIAVADIPSGTFAQEGNVIKFYSASDLVAGKKASPYVHNIRIVADKAAATDVFSVGDFIAVDIANQNVVTDGTANSVRCGIVAEASGNGAAQVDFILMPGL